MNLFVALLIGALVMFTKASQTDHQQIDQNNDNIADGVPTELAVDAIKADGEYLLQHPDFVDFTEESMKDMDAKYLEQAMAMSSPRSLGFMNFIRAKQEERLNEKRNRDKGSR